MLRPLFEVSQYLLAETDPQRLRSTIYRFGAGTIRRNDGAGLYNVEAIELHLVSGRGFRKIFINRV